MRDQPVAPFHSRGKSPQANSSLLLQKNKYIVDNDDVM